MTRPSVDVPHLCISEAAIVAVMGANGSGKSTAALCMNGMLLPERGEVLVDGLNTREEVTRMEIRKRVGVVFQDPHLQFTSMSVESELAFGLENLGVPGREIRARIEQQMDLFQLRGKRDQVPASLSGGEKQLLAIAAVMLLEPRYLVLDEVTTFLSGNSRVQVFELIANVPARTGAGVILITQNPREAFAAGRLVVFHEGSIAFDGPPETVFRNASSLVKMGVPVPLRERIGLA